MKVDKNGNGKISFLPCFCLYQKCKSNSASRKIRRRSVRRGRRGRRMTHAFNAEMARNSETPGSSDIDTETTEIMSACATPMEDLQTQLDAISVFG